MGLKKDYKEGTKYIYQRIESVSFSINGKIELRMANYERDSDVIKQSDYDALTDEEKSGYIPYDKNPSKYEKKWKSLYKNDFLIDFEDSVTLENLCNNVMNNSYIFIKNTDAEYNTSTWEDF